MNVIRKFTTDFANWNLVTKQNKNNKQVSKWS